MLTRTLEMANAACDYISQMAWHSKTFRQFPIHRLTYQAVRKAQRTGVAVSFVDPAYTSQRCSACGHTERRNRKTQAEFCCVVCGHQLVADYNAAINIERAAVNRPMVSNLCSVHWVEAQAVTFTCSS